MAEPRAAAGPAEIHAYTDGGASPNPGPGGWGAVLLRPPAAGDAAGEPRVEELAGGEDHTTNNRMELTAAIRSLEAVGEGARVRVSTDSRYLQRGITSWLPRWAAAGWRLRDGGEVANQDLWRRLAELTATRRVSWHWVKGHAGHRWNERADELARAATARRRQGGSGAGTGAGADGAAGAGGLAAAVDFDIHLKASGRGGWAARARPRGAGGDSGDGKPGDGGGSDGNAGDSELLTGAQRGASANELILLAAAAALESLPPGAAVAIHTASDYLRDGASRWLPGWRRAGWRTKSGGEVANRAAWQRLERALAGRRLHWPRPDEAAAAEIAALEKPAREAAGR